MMPAKTIRIVLGSVALGLWTVYAIWGLIRIGEVGNILIGWVVLAAPVILYMFVVRRQLSSVFAGLVLIGTRVWILAVLETSTSSTAGLVLIPALFIDALAVGSGVIADQLVILLERSRSTGKSAK